MASKKAYDTEKSMCWVSVQCSVYIQLNLDSVWTKEKIIECVSWRQLLHQPFTVITVQCSGSHTQNSRMSNIQRANTWNYDALAKCLENDTNTHHEKNKNEWNCFHGDSWSIETSHLTKLESMAASKGQTKMIFLLHLFCFLFSWITQRLTKKQLKWNSQSIKNTF